jgi:tetratricopeptide (TPR) repeat protein
MKVLFISHSGADGLPFSEHLYAALRNGQPSYEAWVDKRHLPVGYPYPEQIDIALGNCDVVLAVVTRDSASSQGVGVEIGRAKELGKRIVPLRVHGDATMPLPLVEHEAVDFTQTFKRGMTRLRELLGRLETPQERLAEAEARLKVVERRRARQSGAAGRRLDPEIRLRKHELEDLRWRAANPDSSKRVKHEGIARGLIREGRYGPHVVARSGVRYVNDDELPLTTHDWFQDRADETRDLRGLLDAEAVRIVVVAGPDGIGKTAIVSWVLRPPEGADGPSRVPAEAVVYLPVRGARPVTAAALLTDLRRALPSSRTAGLHTMLADGALTSAEKLEAVLERFGGRRRVVVAIDNLEDLLDDATGAFRDGELLELLSILVGRRQHGVKVILVTRTGTEPRPLLRGAPAGEITFPVDDGLRSPHAERFLRALDGDGGGIVAKLPRQQLSAVSRLAGGRPRALEALHFLLARDVELKRLLEEMEAAAGPDAVVDLLVGRVVAKLGELDRRVVQALAVYGRPVDPAAVDYLVEPYLPGYQSRLALERLLEQRLVRRQGERWFLPSSDCARVLRGIPPRGPGDLTRERPPLTLRALRHLAANYFGEVREIRGEIRSIDDLNPHFREIELRLQAGERQAAHALIDEVDYGWLRRRGFAHLVSSWREGLVGRLGDPLLEAMNLDALGNASRQRDDQDRAIRYFKKALPLAGKTEFAPYLLPALHINLGGACVDSSRFQAAGEYFEWALETGAGLARIQAQARMGLGTCAAESGQFGEALDHLALATKLVEAAVDPALGAMETESPLTRELVEVAADDPSLRAIEIEVPLNAGLWYGQLGEPEHALDYLYRARDLAAARDERLLEGKALGAIAEVLIDQAHLGQGIDLARRAIALGRQLDSPSLLRDANVTLAQALLCAGSVAKALSAADAARRRRASRRALPAYTLYGIAALRNGDRALARSGFEEAHREAMRLRQRHKRHLGALDGDGLALCGLALCDEPAWLDQAVASFGAARTVSSERGVVCRIVRLLDELRVADEQGLLSNARKAALGA